MAVRAGDRQTEGAACGNLGVVLLEQGDPAAAVDWFRHHARLAEGAPRMVGTATVNIGLCLDRLGDRTEAAVVLARAADLLDAAGDPIAATVRRQLAVWAG
jgi:Tfp pilus assembly protein PilF